MTNLKTCYQCNERVFPVENELPTFDTDGFEIDYVCPNGHTGKLMGFANQDPDRWTRTGEIHSPNERSDIDVQATNQTN
jgi:hypothetical protein